VVFFSLGGITKKSNRKKSYLSPIWRERFELIVYGNPGKQYLMIHAKDSRKRGVGILGTASISLSQIQNSSAKVYSIDLEKGGKLNIRLDWHPFHGESPKNPRQLRRRRRSAGRRKSVSPKPRFTKAKSPAALPTQDVIRQRESIGRRSASADFTVPDLKSRESESEAQDLSSDEESSMSEVIRVDIPDLESSHSGLLHVTVIRCVDLVTSEDKSVDPYVYLVLGKQKKKTQILWKTANPVWNETFEFMVSDDRQEFLTVKVYDKEIFRIDAIEGEVQIPIQEVIQLAGSSSPYLLKKTWPLDKSKTACIELDIKYYQKQIRLPGHEIPEDDEEPTPEPLYPNPMDYTSRVSPPGIDLSDRNLGDEEGNEKREGGTITPPLEGKASKKKFLKWMAPIMGWHRRRLSGTAGAPVSPETPAPKPPRKQRGSLTIREIQLPGGSREHLNRANKTSSPSPLIESSQEHLQVLMENDNVLKTAGEEKPTPPDI
ncbi:hypothetical protein AAMO2058_001037600, partial [Amorphochlora amoebiformis]